MPVTTPLLGSRFNPAGSTPEAMLKVYGVTPPLGVRGEKLVIAESTVRFCAVVVAAAVIGTAAAATLKLTLLIVPAKVLLASLTENTTFAVEYGAVGIPSTIPVLALKFKPVGNVPE